MQEFIDKLIGRLEEGIYSFEERMKYDTKTQKHLISQNNGIKYAITIAKELAEQHNNGWISVNDRLPDKEGSYLVIGRTGGATVTRWYLPNNFHPQGHFGGNSADYIRYWMPRPLPPDYKEGGV